jgi:hypothetical protein
MNFWWHRITRRPVRIVRMDGCMAHVRGNVRNGVIIGFIDRTIYGGGKKMYRFAQIEMRDGRIEERVAEDRLWHQNETDGIWEYQE